MRGKRFLATLIPRWALSSAVRNPLDAPEGTTQSEAMATKVANLSYCLLALGVAMAILRSKVPRSFRIAFCLCLGAVLFSGCAQKREQSFFEGNTAQEAVRKLSEKMTSPVRVLSLEIKPMTLTMQVQDPAAPGQVNEYTYRKLTGLSALIFPMVVGPKPVRLNLINPSLEENLFDLSKVNFAAVPETVGEAVRRVALEGGGAVQTIHIQRQIRILPPASGDIEWDIFVGGPRESASAYADAQGRLQRFNLDGTRRAQTLDYTKDSKTLLDTIAEIRDQFGSDAVFNYFRVSRLDVAFEIRDSKNLDKTRGYNCNLNGIRPSLDDAMNIKLPHGMEKQREYFSIDDTDWSRVPAMCKTALEKIILPHPNILDIELTKPPPTLREQPLRWRAQVIEGAMGEYGFVEFDPKTGQVMRVDPPDSQIKPVDFLEPAKTPELLASIKEDFGPAAQFKEITVNHDRAWAKGTAPAHPDEVREYDYNAAKRADPGLSNGMKSPFDKNLGPLDLFGAAEFQGFEPRLSELEQKTLNRLRLTNGKIDRLTFFRQSPIYPGNKKLLLEIRCEGNGDDGRIVYDLAGNEFDLVGGNPLSPSRSTGPQIKSGIFIGGAVRTTSGADSGESSDRDVDSLYNQWQAMLDADGVAEDKCSATRWGQLAEKGPVSPTDLSRKDYREYRLAEQARIATAKKCLAFLERPSTKARIKELMTTTERHGLDQRKFFDPQFWHATIRRMVASNELKKMTEEHWEDFLHGGSPAEGPNLKDWQRKYLHVEAEEKAAREERHRIIAKYEDR